MVPDRMIPDCTRLLSPPVEPTTVALRRMRSGANQNFEKFESLPESRIRCWQTNGGSHEQSNSGYHSHRICPRLHLRTATADHDGCRIFTGATYDIYNAHLRTPSRQAPARQAQRPSFKHDRCRHSAVCQLHLQPGRPRTAPPSACSPAGLPCSRCST